jgi:hypothetical protein
MKCNICHEKNEKKDKFESPYNESLGFKCDTQSCLDPITKYILYLILKHN